MSTVSSKKPTKAKATSKPASKPAKAAAKPKTATAAKAPATKVAPPDSPSPVSAVGTAPVVPGQQAEPAVIESLSPVIAGRELRKKELFDLVTARSGMKKKDVKPVVEAMLAVMGEALSEHRTMHLMPMGKVKIQRAREIKGGRAIILKLRQKSTDPAPDADSD